MTNPRRQEILIVEDSRTQAEHLKQMLEQNGYRVDVARDGQEALQQLAQGQPEMVVTDIMMPGMNGYELCQTIKADERLSQIPVVLLTTLSEPIDVIKGLESGADNFIIKPYTEADLLSRMAFMLSNRHLRRHEPAEMGVEITFDGRNFFINSDRIQILNLLLSTYETAVQRNRELTQTQDELKELNERLEELVEERTASLKKALESVREQAALLDRAHDAIIVYDLEKRITYWNKAAESVFGRASSEVLGQPIDEILYKDQKEVFEEHYEKVRQYGEWRADFAVSRADGAKVTVECRQNLLDNDDGAAPAILSIHNDVTDKKRIEEQFFRAQRMESIGSLASGVAHDLNNILSPIRMAVEMLGHKVQDESAQKFLKVILEASQRGSELVKQVLTFARGGEGVPLLISPKHVIGEILNIITNTFPKSIRVKRSVPRDLWLLRADVTQLQQVLMNLCVNARDAMMPQGGTLTLAARNIQCDRIAGRLALDANPGPFVCITVSDSGSGIPKEMLDLIFDPFFTTKERDKGTGLGLSTTVGIIKSHGGFIDVESAVDRGTTFSIYLPATQTEALQTEQKERRQAVMGHGEWVLVVDDEPEIRDLVRAGLEQSNYRVLVAEDGSEAVALLASHLDRVQAALVDMMMPVMNGEATIRTLRKLNPRVKIIASSGLEEQVSSENLAALNVQRVLVKPYSYEDLVSALHELFEDPSPDTSIDGSSETNQQLRTP